jgi:hypothetical protein
VFGAFVAGREGESGCQVAGEFSEVFRGHVDRRDLEGGGGIGVGVGV